MKNSTVKTFIALHILLIAYSLGGIFSKLASAQPFLSFHFCLYYGVLILILGLYAIGWQQIIRHLPLTTAFANKAITVVWGILWGKVLFGEEITIGKLIGAALVIAGVVLYASSGTEDSHES